MNVCYKILSIYITSQLYWHCSERLMWRHLVSESETVADTTAYDTVPLHHLHYQVDSSEY